MNLAAAFRLSPLPAFLSDPALGRVLDALAEARIVGGAVRDSILGRPVADIDLATPDRPEAVIEALARAGIRAEPTGLAHGTVTAIAGGRGFEVTTLRMDIETDGRRAVVAFTDDWRADASRRDFTFNAMSMTRDGAVFDYFGGVADLRAGITRFVGAPATRIAEDFLRILRFFRFHAHYGTQPPDDATLVAIRAGLPGLAGLSAERVWSELRRILAAPDPREAVRLMGELGVLAAVIPQGSDSGSAPGRLDRLIRAGAPEDPMLRLAALLSGDAAALAVRLKLSTAERQRLVGLSQGPVPRPEDDDAALRRMLAHEPAPMLIDRCWLADDLALDWPGVRARLAAMACPVFPLVGRDVVARGVPPGPAVGRILAQARTWWLEGGCVADRAALLARIDGLIPPPDTGGPTHGT